jgi:hypothetical protein
MKRFARKETSCRVPCGAEGCILPLKPDHNGLKFAPSILCNTVSACKQYFKFVWYVLKNYTIAIECSEHAAHAVILL